jgi:hypothetical protein
MRPFLDKNRLFIWYHQPYLASLLSNRDDTSIDTYDILFYNPFQIYFLYQESSKRVLALEVNLSEKEKSSMYRIRMFMVTLVVLAALLFTSMLATGAHAATRSSSSAPNHSVTSSTVHPLVNEVPCWYFHAVEIINNTGELCFEGSGYLLVNIYHVTSILDTGNNGNPEGFECNHYFLVELTGPGQSWSGYCYDLTSISL